MEKWERELPPGSTGQGLVHPFLRFNNLKFGFRTSKGDSLDEDAPPIRVHAMKPDGTSVCGKKPAGADLVLSDSLPEKMTLTQACASCAMILDRASRSKTTEEIGNGQSGAKSIQRPC